MHYARGNKDLENLLRQHGSGRDFSVEIHDAALAGDLERVKALLKTNPDLLVSKDDNGRTLLHDAVKSGHTNMIEFLLANKADVNAKDNGGSTALNEAYTSADVAKMLLSAGADKDAADNLGFTTLIEAAETGSTKVVKLLLDAGANKDAFEHDNGQIALTAAADHGD